MSNNKQTVLQEILDTLENDWLSPQPYIDLVISKLEKERLQIINAYDDGSLSEMQYPDKNAEDYYIKTYGGNNEKNKHIK